jgi:ZIP family zinc transporter
MMESLRESGPVVQALLATIGTYLLTAIGTIPVLFFRSVPRRAMDAMMGFAAGVMVAASCWSLLVPAIERGGVFVAAVGLLAGGAFLYVADQSLPHLHAEFPDEATSEGPNVAWHRSALLMLAMTLHNFPEGMAVGVGFGASMSAQRWHWRSGSGCRTFPKAWRLRCATTRRLTQPRVLLGPTLGGDQPVAGVSVGALVTSAAFLPARMPHQARQPSSSELI